MMKLETRFNVTSEELAEIKQKALCVFEQMGGTYTEIFSAVLNDAQFIAYKSNAMTKALCDDLLIF